tara:strand:+ start:262 stop:438 length:177 start_codon:yes stop_codon:yes gene_type:complete
MDFERHCDFVPLRVCHGLALFAAYFYYVVLARFQEGRSPRFATPLLITITYAVIEFML